MRSTCLLLSSAVYILFPATRTLYRHRYITFAAYPFTADAVIPCSRYSRPARNTNTAGTSVITAATKEYPACSGPISGR